MKIKDGFILRQVDENFMLVPVGARTLSFSGIMNLNETGAFLFEKIKENVAEEDLYKTLLEEYDVSEELAKSDVEKFLQKLRDAGIVDE